MKINIAVAGVLVGAAITPLACHFCHLADGTLEQWTIAVFRHGHLTSMFGMAAVACMAVGLLASLLAMRVIRPTAGSGPRHTSMWRSTLAAAVLTPLGVAVLVLAWANHTSHALTGVVRPPFYFDHLAGYSAIAAAVGAVLAIVLNGAERHFGGASSAVRLGIVCCQPLAWAFAVVCMAGLLGGGLLGGLETGRHFGCPLTGLWTGGLLGAAVLCLVGGVFWPSRLLHTSK